MLVTTLMMEPAASRQLPGRERILEEAREQFVAYGYAGVTMQRIADAIGVTKAALYYHVADKEELFAEAFVSEMERVCAGIASRAGVRAAAGGATDGGRPLFAGHQRAGVGAAGGRSRSLCRGRASVRAAGTGATAARSDQDRFRAGRCGRRDPGSRPRCHRRALPVDGLRPSAQRGVWTADAGHERGAGESGGFAGDAGCWRTARVTRMKPGAELTKPLRG